MPYAAAIFFAITPLSLIITPQMCFTPCSFHIAAADFRFHFSLASFFFLRLMLFHFRCRCHCCHFAIAAIIFRFRAITYFMPFSPMIFVAIFHYVAPPPCPPDYPRRCRFHFIFLHAFGRCMMPLFTNIAAATPLCCRLSFLSPLELFVDYYY